MQIIRSSIDTQKGPADWFTGDVYIDSVAAPAGSSTFAAALVRFTPSARTAWHTHPHGQTIFVTEGVGLCQREGGPVEVIGAGDRVFFEAGENHWHGAAPSRFMAHLAMHALETPASVRRRERRPERGCSVGTHGLPGTRVARDVCRRSHRRSTSAVQAGWAGSYLRL